MNQVLRVVVDSNEYILGLPKSGKDTSKALITTLPNFDLRINRIIVNEVTKNLTLDIKKLFFELISSLTFIDEISIVSKNETNSFLDKGLKPADAFIAAYTNTVDADSLITENRHFMRGIEIDQFYVVNAEEFLEIALNHQRLS